MDIRREDELEEVSQREFEEQDKGDDEMETM
jgi:hypothetical protein